VANHLLSQYHRYHFVQKGALNGNLLLHNTTQNSSNHFPITGISPPIRIQLLPLEQHFLQRYQLLMVANDNLKISEASNTLLTKESSTRWMVFKYFVHKRVTQQLEGL